MHGPTIRHPHGEFEPPLPVTRVVGCTVGPHGAYGELRADNAVIYVATANEHGRMDFTIPFTLTGGADLTVSFNGYQSVTRHVALNAELLDAPLDLESSRVALPRIIRRGHCFGLANGEQWTAIEASDFNLFARGYQEGADAIRPVLQQRKDCGYNLLRVWTDFDLLPGIGRLLMREHPDAYDHLLLFCDLCAEYGFYVEFTAYTGQHTPDHWARLTTALRDVTNAICSLVNENDAHDNRVDIDAFSPVPWMLCSHGSNGADSDTVRPVWGYGEYHTNGLSEWWRKTGHNAMELDAGPMLAGENTRFIDGDDSPEHAYDAAAGAALLCAGSCFHSIQGKLSGLWAGRELDCAKAWAAGARSVPLEFQDGRYLRLDNGPNDLRVYQRVLPDGRAFTVRIRP